MPRYAATPSLVAIPDTRPDVVSTTGAGTGDCAVGRPKTATIRAQTRPAPLSIIHILSDSAKPSPLDPSCRGYIAMHRRPARFALKNDLTRLFPHLTATVRTAYGWCAGAVGVRRALHPSNSPDVTHDLGHDVRQGSGNRWQGVRPPHHRGEGETGEAFRSNAAPGAPFSRHAGARSGRSTPNHRRHGVAPRRRS